jgi:nucleotide-binding universal stress UspA family protein
MTSRILCAVDGSAHGTEAVVEAAKLAKALDAELLIVAVNALMGGYGRGGVSTYMWQDADVERLLADAKATATKAGYANPKLECVESRDIARAIVMLAEEKKCDHIVVGTGGKSAAGRLILGSVSTDVVHRAHCAVTVAR